MNAFGPQGHVVKWLNTKSARQELTSLGLLLCSCVIMYSFENERDHKGNNSRQCLLGPKGPELQWIKREMRGKT